VTGADAREELESALWRTDPSSIQAVHAVLHAADTYAFTVTAEILARVEHRCGCSVTAARQEALIAGDGKHYGGTS
jgi:hypothetical protein